MASIRLSKEHYSVAWICALSHEMTAGRSMFDQLHDRVPQPPTDTNTYILGSICGHNVVMVCLPAGSIGTNSSATVVAHLRSTFPNIQYGLMVGIGGGAPSKDADIRLGDVVVSQPGDKHPGVIQYDFGKAVAGGNFEQTGTLNRPPKVLLAGISRLKVDYTAMEKPISTLIQEKLRLSPHMSSFSCPGSEQDLLFKATYEHPLFADDCSQCVATELLHRDRRMTQEPSIFYGLIASGNQVMKDGLARENLIRQFPIRCFEMEAAGIMNDIPCLVIRGICDYSDSHKNKKWQGYAAMTAAAYSRLLLSTLQPQSVAPPTSKEAKSGWSAQERECLEKLFVVDPVEVLNSLKRRKGSYAAGTCEWFLKTEVLNQWLGITPQNNCESPKIVWLYGNPGIGKSTMMIALADMLPGMPLFANQEKTLVLFFCESRSDKQRTATSILRGLLYQIIQCHPELMDILLRKYDTQGDSVFKSFDALWTMILEAGKSKDIYCIIDALDECNGDSQETLLAQLNQTYGQGSCSSLECGVHILLTSRPYEEISRHLKVFNNSDLSSFKNLQDDINTLICTKVDDLSKRNRYPSTVKQKVSEILKEKAGGTFLWVGIACGELLHVRSKDAVNVLNKLPRNLDSLYKSLLKSVQDQNLEEYEVITQILGFVAIAFRPLTTIELLEACQLYTSSNLEERLSFIQDDINMCRLLVIVQDGTVSLLHKSLNDFLLRGNDPIINEALMHAKFAYCCLDNLIRTFQPLSPYAYCEVSGTFTRYSAQYWPEHAHRAGGNFEILESHSILFEPKSRIRETWKRFSLYHEIISSSLRDTRMDSNFHIAAFWGLPVLATYALSRESFSDFGNQHTTPQSNTAMSPLEISAAGGHVDVFSMLLDQSEDISDNILPLVIANKENGIEMLKLLLNTHGSEIRITESVAKDIAKRANLENVTYLLSHWKAEFPLTKPVILSLQDNTDKRVIKYFLFHFRHKIIDKESMVYSVVSSGDIEALTMLLDATDGEVLIMQDLVQRIIYLGSGGVEMMKMLLNRLGNQISLSADIDLLPVPDLKECDEKMMGLVLEKLGNTIPKLDGFIRRSPWDRGRALLLLFKLRGDLIPITSQILLAVAKSRNEELLVLILNRPGTAEIQDTEALTRAASWATEESIGLLIKLPNFKKHAVEEIVTWAALNETHGLRILTLLKGSFGSPLPVSEEALIGAAGNCKSGREIFKLFMSQEGCLSITVPMIKKAIACGNIDVVGFFLEIYDLGNLAIEEWVITLARCCRDTRVVSLVFHHWEPEQVPITEEIIELAAANLYVGRPLLEFFLAHGGGTIPLSEEAFSVAAQVDGDGVLELLLSQPEGKLPITSKMIQSAIFSTSSSQIIESLLRSVYKLPMPQDIFHHLVHFGQTRLLPLLFHQYGDELVITDDTISLAVLSSYMESYFEFLVEHAGLDIPLSEEIVEQAARHTGFQGFLRRFGDRLSINEDVIISILSQARGLPANLELVLAILPRLERDMRSIELFKTVAEYGDNRILSAVLSRATVSAQVLQKMVNAAAANETYGPEILEELIGDRAAGDLVTRETVMAALSNTNIKAMQWLVERFGRAVLMTTEMALTAVNNSYNMVELLFSRDITKGKIVAVVGADESARVINSILINAASGHYGSSCKFTRDLIEKLGGKETLTEDVIQAAARRCSVGQFRETIIDMLGDLKVTEAIAKGAARNGHGILKLLGNKAPVTEAVLLAAARAGQTETTKFLLQQKKDVPITQSVVQGATQTGHAILILNVMLHLRPKEFPVTEELLIMFI